MLKKIMAALLAASIVLLAGCKKDSQSTNSSNSSSGAITSAQASDRPARSDEPETVSPRSEAMKVEVSKEPHWDQVTPDLSLQIKVGRQPDSSNSSQSSPRDMYRVEVSLKNSGAAITFDAAEASFVPSEGDPLRVQVQQGYDTMRNADLTRTNFIYKGLKPETGNDSVVIQKVKLGKGEPKKWDFQTDGFTSDLLNQSRSAPLVLEFNLLLDKKVVAGPFRAALPSLNDLPSSGSAHEPLSAGVYPKAK